MVGMTPTSSPESDGCGFLDLPAGRAEPERMSLVATVVLGALVAADLVAYANRRSR